MALRTISRKVKMELLTEDGDITEMIFSHHRTQKACRLFLEELKLKKGLTRKEMNAFGTALGSGKLALKYSRVHFYVQIRRTLLTLGLIGIQQRYTDLKEMELSPERKKHRIVVDKYVPVRQPVPRRPPDGLNLVRLTWIICTKWNNEFFNQFLGGENE